MAKDKKDAKTDLKAEEILKRRGGFVEADGDSSNAIELPDQRVFDDDMIDKNIIVFSVKEAGKRTTQFGETTDYDIRCEDEHGMEYHLRTNHAYAYALIERLDKYKKPIRCRIIKKIRKDGKPRYFLDVWMKQESTASPF